MTVGDVTYNTEIKKIIENYFKSLFVDSCSFLRLYIEYMGHLIRNITIEEIKMENKLVPDEFICEFFQTFI